jgi:hypothetical protein
MSTSPKDVNKLTLAEARALGAREADADVRQGRLEIQTMGRPPEWMDLYKDAMLERYGIVARFVAGCILTPSVIARMEAYNEVSKRAILERFGRQVDREMLEEQRDLWYAMQPPEE